MAMLCCKKAAISFDCGDIFYVYGFILTDIFRAVIEGAGTHPSDVGVMLDKISAFEDSAPASVLDSVPSKGEEGEIIL